MALCVLAAGWKSEGLSEKDGSSGFIGGLLGIIVDHALRPESAEEARLVQQRVNKIGVRCEIACCNWPEGKPKIGHLQEAAREMRYQIFQEVCVEKQIGVLLVAHHADDQAELFVLRLSRNSGVFGLAGMAFVLEIFPAHSSHCWDGYSKQGIMLVRPMLEFSKDDMYKICQDSQQIWVEDPTNRNLLFTRNRIRMSLNALSSSSFCSEIKRIITACRSTRMFIESICCKMLNVSVSIKDEGYCIVDVEKLDPSNVDDLYLSKFLVMILQFVSQRQRPIRGRAVRLLLEYIRSIPCKTSLTAAGCYLCAAPQSRGAKVIICCSPEALLPSKKFFYYKDDEQRPSWLCLMDQIMRDMISHSDDLAMDASSVPFLHAKSPDAVLREAMELKLISESTYTSIRSLQMEEHKNFSSTKEADRVFDSRYHAKVSSSLNIRLCAGQSCHFMCRFLVTWKPYNKKYVISSDLNEFNLRSKGEFCQLCVAPIRIRCMVDADWLYLAKLFKSDEHQVKNSIPGMEDNEVMELGCYSFMKSSAQAALQKLKSIPAPARRTLPVLVSSRDLPLCIPSIEFSSCQCLLVAAEFRPRVPLGGGYSSYL
ncbi:tRNA(Ile)-lysidine synthase, chloroplastic [Apostasia shenzhenica]|uniref:tRNA(Ile)-lysidine synthetase n=1 Tax=Apostasia shenzhenica TaxID=1088818 RepID=A0A2I0B6P7_9ASPA|nr:tRNA(Ile)-lysidine synthase, chloroplastic [Apostasia shenzhenica]